MTSVHSQLKLPVDVNTLTKGTITLWVLPLEELSHRLGCADKRGAHPGTDYNNHILIGDHPDPENVCDSRFALIWDSGWYPQFWAKFFQGYLYHDGFRPERKLLALAGHCSFERLEWVQLALSWDKHEGRCTISINGVPVAESPDDAPLAADECGKVLYAGSTAFALGDIAVYDDVLNETELSELYQKEATDFDAKRVQKLRDMYLGENPESFSFNPDDEWRTTLDLPLNRPQDMDHFYVQGRTQAPQITDEGLRVDTGPDYPPMDKSVDDLQQVYLWTEKVFEGDLYVSYDYMPLKPGGLSLLLTQASGLKGEDFMADYPRRTTGSMSMVCWENVRNYHWEYFRETVDARPGRNSSGFIKNPWCTPLAYQCQPAPTEKNRWHRLEYLQQGNRIQGALDGILMFDVTDDGFRGNGPVYRHGHIAIRCMFRTHMLFRNLKVMNRPPEFSLTEVHDLTPIR
jgi:hypothetical protein